MPLLVAHGQCIYKYNQVRHIINVSNFHNRTDPSQQFRHFSRQRWSGIQPAELVAFTYSRISLGTMRLLGFE